MKFLSLFAGIGGFDLGLERAGHECVGQVEIDEACQRVLERRFPAVTRYADVAFFAGVAKRQRRRLSSDRRESERGVRGTLAVPEDGDGAEHPVGSSGIDLLCGGFPCQDLSVAGKRRGLAGERSGLFWEIVRIAKEIRPAWGLFENVPGLLSSHNGRDFWTVLSGLRECWPVVGYRVLDSQFFGVAQRRRRVFIVCGPSERSVAAVLFEPEGGGGDSAASGETGARVAAATGERIAATLKQRGRGATDEVMDNLIAETAVAASLTAGVARARGVNPPGRRREDDENLIVQQAMSAKWSKGSSGPAGDEHHNLIVTHPLKAEGADASEDGTGRGVPMVTEDVFGALRGFGHGWQGQHNDDAARAAMVRRLTPTECERLQGFPDGWTDVPGSSDSTRYRQLGNAVTVNVAEWLGKRLPL